MNWPFVTRRAYDLVASELVSTKRELHRWQDIVAKQNWGHQIHDTLPIAVVETKVEEAIPEAQATEEEMQAEHRRELAQITSIARTRKSQLPGMMERLMSKRLVQRAKAAVSSPAPVQSKEDTRKAVAARFERLKAETIRAIH